MDLSSTGAAKDKIAGKGFRSHLKSRPAGAFQLPISDRNFADHVSDQSACFNIRIT